MSDSDPTNIAKLPAPAIGPFGPGMIDWEQLSLEHTAALAFKESCY